MSDMSIIYGKESKLSKKEKYGWITKDVAGELRMLHKGVLQVHPGYQRDASTPKVLAIAAAWSWIACGAIIVGERGGELWTIDGNHRVLAARRRNDIDLLPCIVFKTDSVKQEAQGFLSVNTNRKPMSGIDKFRASISAGDETAIYIDTIFNQLGIKVAGSAKHGMEINSMGWCMESARIDRDVFESVVTVAAELCADHPVLKMLLEGLWYIDMYSPIKLNDKRLRSRIIKIGAPKLIESAQRAAAYFARGGARIFAQGMLTEINRGLRDKFTVIEPGES